MRTTLVFLLALTATITTGCDRDNNRPAAAPMTPSGALAAQPVSMHDVTLITNERCDREQRCTNIGVDRKYSTREVCEAQIRSDNMNALTNAACPYGINAAKLQTCLTSIRGEACNNPIDALERYAACMRRALCPD